jgi:hypothetical protein
LAQNVLGYKIMFGFLKMPWNIRCAISRVLFFIGIFIFIASIPLSQYIAEYFGYTNIFYKLDAGYMFGYIFGNATYLINQIKKGKIDNFVYGNVISRILFYFAILIIIIVGIISFIVMKFGHNTGPFFILSFTIGSLLMKITKMFILCDNRSGNSKKL